MKTGEQLPSYGFAPTNEINKVETLGPFQAKSGGQFIDEELEQPSMSNTISIPTEELNLVKIPLHQPKPKLKIVGPSQITLDLLWYRIVDNELI